MMNEQQVKEFWRNLIVGFILGVFVGWQLWFSITLYQWTTRSGGILHNYMTEIL